jgi:hypothetical protein
MQVSFMTKTTGIPSSIFPLPSYILHQTSAFFPQCCTTCCTENYKKISRKRFGSLDYFQLNCEQKWVTILVRQKQFGTYGLRNL